MYYGLQGILGIRGVLGRRLVLWGIMSAVSRTEVVIIQCGESGRPSREQKS